VIFLTIEPEGEKKKGKGWLIDKYFFDFRKRKKKKGGNHEEKKPTLSLSGTVKKRKPSERTRREKS